MEIPETDSEDEMAPGWEERCTTDGLVFYAHHATKTTQWHHPRTNKKKRVTGELPFGWERQITEEGKVFFVDHLNHKTTYTDPRLAFAVEESKSLTDLRQRFDSSTTGIQILHGRDLTGRIAIVTGANCGIGYETARSLAYHGCTVVFACRDLTKAEAAIARIQKQRPSSTCHALQVDLASLTSVRMFAHTFSVRFGRCDVLLLNAGVFGLPHTLTEDGLETTFQVNHLSQFYLALLLQPLLVQSTPARVIFVSSESHRFATLNTENISEDLLSPSHKSSYTSIIAYCNTKLCNVLTALEMQRRFGDQGINCYAVHPGNAVSTYLTRHWWAYRLLYAVVRPFTKSLQACATSVYCAASVDISRFGGIYVNNCVPCLPSQSSLDSILSNRLWITSLSMIEHVLGRRAFSMQPLSKCNEQSPNNKGEKFSNLVTIGVL
ncbi:WW domain-containing oxidoreductase isoform X2 [Cherax quadricarinatus]|uniref:WW domain-containing oxidoreductase isoform X2 n=1 Tax=Cherax quadricarinatus TaxID=27406 RepID=UPI002379773C|nr:WW domain-containing oxidoreductase-like isoform X2 [Cherax quadricarinatus]